MPKFDSSVLSTIPLYYSIDLDFILYSLVVLISVFFTLIAIEFVFINFSGGAKKIGEKIVTGLGIGAAASGTYQGVKEVYNDITGRSNSTGNNGNQGSNNGNQGSNNGSSSESSNNNNNDKK